MRAGLLIFVLLGVPISLRADTPPVSGTADLTDEQLIAKLIEGLDDADTEVRMNLAMALSQFGSKTVPNLIDALERGSPFRRAGAAYALSQLRGAARPALPSLLKALKAREDLVRRNASYAIQRIVSNADAVPRSESLKPPVVLPPLDPPPSVILPGGAR